MIKKELLTHKYAWVTYIITGLAGTGTFVGLPAGEKVIQNFARVEFRQDQALKNDTTLIDLTEEVLKTNEELKIMLLAKMYLEFRDNDVDSTINEIKKQIVADRYWRSHGEHGH